MKEIIIRSQKEWDKLPRRFEELTRINITGKIAVIVETPKNSIVLISGSASIEYVYGSASIESVSGSASIKSVSGSASIKYVSGSASIESVSGSASIESVYGSASIESVSGSASIKSVSGSASIESVSSNVVIRILSKKVRIKKGASGYAVIIYQNTKKQSQLKKEKTVTIVETKTVPFSLDEFITRYDVEMEQNNLVLFKAIRTDGTDFYTGQIKYISFDENNKPILGKCVIAPDWQPGIDIECGYGLHLAVSTSFADYFVDRDKKRIYLKCSVPIKINGKANIRVHPDPSYPHKVVCGQLEIIAVISQKEEK